MLFQERKRIICTQYIIQLVLYNTPHEDILQSKLYNSQLAGQVQREGKTGESKETNDQSIAEVKHYRLCMGTSVTYLGGENKVAGLEQ